MVMKFMATSWITAHTNGDKPYLYKDLLEEYPEFARDMLDAVGEFSSSGKVMQNILTTASRNPSEWNI